MSCQCWALRLLTPSVLQPARARVSSPATGEMSCMAHGAPRQTTRGFGPSKRTLLDQGRVSSGATSCSSRPPSVRHASELAQTSRVCSGAISTRHRGFSAAAARTSCSGTMREGPGANRHRAAFSCAYPPQRRPRLQHQLTHQRRFHAAAAASAARRAASASPPAPPFPPASSQESRFRTTSPDAPSAPAPRKHSL